MASNVKLIIKAANQKYEDFIVENFDLDTTIRNLKTHLTVNYPSNPDTDTIRLIYSGKLLHDHWTLKECIRHVCKMRFVDSYYCIFFNKKKIFLFFFSFSHKELQFVSHHTYRSFGYSNSKRKELF